MNKFLTLLFCLILLLAPITGCLEETTPEDETTPEEGNNEDTLPDEGGTDDNSNENETEDNTGGGGEVTEPEDNTDNDNTNQNETGDNTGGGGEVTEPEDNTDNDNTNPNQNQTEDDTGDGEETDPEDNTDDDDGEDNSGGGQTEPGDGTGEVTEPGDGSGDDGGEDITGGTTTDCGTSEGGFAFSITEFDFSNHPDYTNIGGLEIECSSNILYGFAWDDVEDVEYFVSIDPANGLVTSLTPITGIELITQHSTFGNNEYFAIMAGDGIRYLVQISISNTYTVSLTEFDYSNHPELENVAGIEYDHANDILYGYAFEDTDEGEQNTGPGQVLQPADLPPVFVVTIDPSTGIVTKHSEIEDIDGIADGASAYDGENYYLKVRNSGGGYSMATIDVSDFSISMSSVLSSTNEDLTSPNGFEVNIETGLIYGYAWDSVNEEEVFISYNIDTEAITQIGVITGIVYVTAISTQEGVDFYAMMADDTRQNYLVHIQY